MSEDEKYEPDSLDVVPLSVLADCMKRLQEEKNPPSKMLIILLYDEPDGNYDTSWYNAGMKASELVSLLEVIKFRVIAKTLVPIEPKHNEDEE